MTTPSSVKSSSQILADLSSWRESNASSLTLLQPSYYISEELSASEFRAVSESWNAICQNLISPNNEIRLLYPTLRDKELFHCVFVDRLIYLFPSWK